MKSVFAIVLVLMTTLVSGQKEFRIEHTNNGFDVYDGYLKVESVEKNYSNGYDVYVFDEWGVREKIQSVEKGYGDEYVVYTYTDGYKEKSHTIRGYDQYLRELYADSGPDSSPVNVYDVPGEYRSNLGITTLPAAVQPLDYSALDRALQAQYDTWDKERAEMDKIWKRAQEIAVILERGGFSDTEHNKLINELKTLQARLKAMDPD